VNYNLPNLADGILVDEIVYGVIAAVPGESHS